ncbi:hypothetical protein [Paraburkholderia diazotrophica]|uniref:Pectate lyase superfamily protein n=1 Tax=Paraburkholderia diazotrophica TaxID=667676 RepID=A0A1H6V3A5_9BURK|nr:hypothetical protein [Paraburkholderia diazotrophica]SEI96317.1 hypothetical protein SAMN05192539_1005213 [Paraburkholderia diazotrophica]
MTITSAVRKAGPFNGNNVATSFPFSFKVFDKTNIGVVRAQGLGIGQFLVLDSDYSVALNADQNNSPGGTVTYPISGMPLPAGYSLTILGALPYTQPTDITNSGGFYPTVIEDALDRAEIQIQQLAEIGSRTLQFPPADSASPLLGAASDRAGTALGFDANGNAIAIPLPTSIGAGDLKNESWTAGIDYVQNTSTTVALSRAYTSKANLGSVVMDGVGQDPNTYSLVGAQLQFNAPIPAGRVWCVGGTTLSLNTPASGSVGDNELAWGEIIARYANSMAEARTLPAAKYRRVKLSGYYAAGDGGGRAEYRYDPTDATTADDGFSCYIASDGGRMKLIPAGRISAKQAGCKGDATYSVCGTGTDDTARAQIYLSWCNAHARVAYFPGSAYRFSNALNIDNSGQTTFPQGRISIEGDGPQNTSFQWDNGSVGGLSVNGSVTSIAATSMQAFRGFSVIKGDGNATGMYMQSHAHLTLENLWVLGWSTGIDYEDVQESLQINVNAQYNVIGLHAQRLSFSLPNALSFYNCTYGNNKQAGIDAINVNTFTYVGGSIESNNDLGGGPYTPIWGCRLITNSSAVDEGTACGTFIGVYFERNGSATVGKGIADLWYANYATSSTLVVKGCTFNRGTTFSTNQIFIDTSGGFPQKVVLEGNGHSAPPVGGYPGASSSRPYLGFGSTTDPVQLVDLGNYYQSSVEAPNYSGSVNMPPSPIVQAAHPVAWVTFNGSTGVITNSFNVSSVTRNGAGLYTVNFARQVSAANLAVNITLNASGFPAYNSLSASGVGVQTQNPSGANTDFTNITAVVYGGNLT